MIVQKWDCAPDVAGAIVTAEGPVVVMLQSGAAIVFEKMPAFLSVEDMDKIWSIDDEDQVVALIRQFLEKAR